MDLALVQTILSHIGSLMIGIYIGGILVEKRNA
jgi:hypothetical protein